MSIFKHSFHRHRTVFANLLLLHTVVFANVAELVGYETPRPSHGTRHPPPATKIIIACDLQVECKNSARLGLL